MSDPDRDIDTEPTGYALDSGEGPDLDADMATEPIDPPCADTEEGPGEHDTDDFLRWLPTLALGHRRRTELVERPASDGANFAAYACEGRPVATSGQARIESAVKVQMGRGSKDLDRDAPTVLTEEKRARRRWRRLGWLAVGAVGAGAAIAGWAERPAATEKALRRSETFAKAPMPMGAIPARSTEAAQSIPAPLGTLLPASPPDVARTAADPRAVPSSTGAADGARKREGAGPSHPLLSSTRRRTAPQTAAPSLPAKDEYFEAP
ncbi:MAG: hypothetical protein ACRENE_05575 [Polyangiaceae bacterium]